MNTLVLTTIIVPFTGFILLAFSRGYLPKSLSTIIGVGSIGIAALVTLYIDIKFINNGYTFFIVPLWNWMSIDAFNISANLLLDSLSLTMISITTSIGFLIHVFASWYMNNEEGYSRFFSYTNLFIASMLILLLADNLLLMYLGWEGVGLCSYLLIGFYYSDSKNGAAAMKAFIVTRISDVCLLFALFILYNTLGTLNFHAIIQLIKERFSVGTSILWWPTMMLLCGAVGKSAQFPLQIWLTDAMVGPTPSSALIHAATMVTAGVYLIARTHGLFLITQNLLHLVGIIGIITLILSSFAALVQTDIKRILAYSTMSQLGYMFLALGSQAWNAAIFHLITHAFSKTLLFLSSGSLISACSHERNIFKMGGSLRKSIPLIYFCFLVGGAALVSIPLLTASFFSKEEILAGVIAAGHINWLIIGLVGNFMTSLYTFRMIFIVFHGRGSIVVNVKRNIVRDSPLIILLIFSSFIGSWIKLPLDKVLPNTTVLKHHHMIILEMISSVITIFGILSAALLWLGKQRTLVYIIVNSSLGQVLKKWWYTGLGFDWFYNLIFVKLFLCIAKAIKYDPLDMIMKTPAILSRFLSHVLLFSESGYLRWYMSSMSIGAIIMLMLLTMLPY